MPSCSNLLCKCKPNNQSSERRSLGKRKKTEGCEWLKFREYDMPIPTPSHDEIIVEIDACLANIIKESVRETKIEEISDGLHDKLFELN